MFKRLLFIFFFCVVLISPVIIEAKIQCRGGSGYLKCSSEVCVVTLLQGVPGGSNTIFVCADIHVNQVEGQCWNKPLNANEAQGVIFNPQLSISGGTWLDALSYDDQGQCVVEICFDTNYEGLRGLVQDAIDETYNCPDDPAELYCPGSGVCVNPGWWFDRYTWEMDTVHVYHTLYHYDPKLDLKNQDQLCRKCSGEGTECGFSCEEVNLSECTDLGLDKECAFSVYCLLNPGDPECPLPQ